MRNDNLLILEFLTAQQLCPDIKPVNNLGELKGGFKEIGEC